METDSRIDYLITCSLIIQTLSRIDKYESDIEELHQLAERVIKKTGDTHKLRFDMYRLANLAHQRIAYLRDVTLPARIRFYEQYL